MAECEKELREKQYLHMYAFVGSTRIDQDEVEALGIVTALVALKLL